MTTSEIATVLAWHDALVEGEIATLESLSAEGIELGAAEGGAQGRDALREWTASTRIISQVGKIYVHEGVVVVELIPDNPAEPPEAAAFQVVHDHVTAIFRHPSLAAALAATGLAESDRVD